MTTPIVGVKGSSSTSTRSGARSSARSAKNLHLERTVWSTNAGSISCRAIAMAGRWRGSLEEDVSVKIAEA